jgi:predicted 3-demethylubiquinone-9 3-methyltransferase (glyoxalase superfamily)
MEHKITPFLWFNGNVGEAIDFYTSVFKNSKLIYDRRQNDKVFTATIEIEGQKLMLLDGGPHYKLSPAFSLFISCADQHEVDEYWNKLIANGGAESKCGWLVDQFGLSWQVIPKALMKYLNDPDPIKAHNVMQAMMKMSKIDIKKLNEAYIL